jgi:cation diffusion facilitator CzcD-associated flavoprotein CzcO
MERTDLVIIGAGWFGLAMAKTYHQVHPGARITIFDDAKSIGGVWAEERLYPGLFTNNLASGYYQYSDFPMSEKRFGIKPKEHIPGSVVHEYLLQYAKEFGIYSFIHFRSKVETAEMKEDGTCHWSTFRPVHSSIRWQRRIQSPHFTPQRTRAAFTSYIF